MKLPHVLCQVLVELGLENGALIRRQLYTTGTFGQQAGFSSGLRQSPHHPLTPPCASGARHGAAASTEPLLPPGSQQRGYPSCSDTREAEAGCASPAAPQPRERCALLLPVPTAARSGTSVGSSAGTGSVVSWLSCWQDQALPGCYRPRWGKQVVLQSMVTAQARLLR